MLIISINTQKTINTYKNPNKYLLQGSNSSKHIIEYNHFIHLLQPSITMPSITLLNLS